MPDYDIVFLGKKAEETGFIRDTLEKVVRLADILEYLNINPFFKESLALKGGTAINLTNATENSPSSTFPLLTDVST